ncbi:Uncharacterised protein [Janthinobacterium lividum]|nr:hypothetical protein JANLI_56410 [Janthinobacterium lividum]STQ98782.1 Uncharacterised protein [Janthinobacterium lividum]
MGRRLKCCQPSSSGCRQPPWRIANYQSEKLMHCHENTGDRRWTIARMHGEGISPLFFAHVRFSGPRRLPASPAAANNLCPAAESTDNSG